MFTTLKKGLSHSDFGKQLKIITTVVKTNSDCEDFEIVAEKLQADEGVNRN